jgi:PTS system cellobiose-specific IIB component
MLKNAALGKTAMERRPLRILFLCQWGASTSYIETRLVEELKKHGVEAEIRSLPIAGGVGESFYEVDYSKVDVILIAPQVRYLVSKVEPKAKAYNIPIVVIPPVVFGRLDTKQMAALILESLKGRQKSK